MAIHRSTTRPDPMNPKAVQPEAPLAGAHISSLAQASRAMHQRLIAAHARHWFWPGNVVAPCARITANDTEADFESRNYIYGSTVGNEDRHEFQLPWYVPDGYDRVGVLAEFAIHGADGANPRTAINHARSQKGLVFRFSTKTLVTSATTTNSGWVRPSDPYGANGIWALFGSTVMVRCGLQHTVTSLPADRRVAVDFGVKTDAFAETYNVSYEVVVSIARLVLYNLPTDPQPD